MAGMKGIEPSTTDRQSVMMTISPHTQLMQLSSYFFIQAPFLSWHFASYGENLFFVYCLEMRPSAVIF